MKSLHMLLWLCVFSTTSMSFGDMRNDFGPVPEPWRPKGQEAIREAIVAIADTHYCGSAMAEGLGTREALSANAPVDGIGFVRLDGEDWVPVAIELADEGLSGYRNNLSEGKTDIANHLANRVSNLVLMVGRSESNHELACGFLERFAKEPIGEDNRFASDLVLGFWDCWFQQADLDTLAGAERCLALGRWMEERCGAESSSLCRYRRTLLTRGLARCGNNDAYAALARHALQLVEDYKDVNNCRMFDKQAVSGNLRGWVGSMQRRRLAARFPDEPIPRVKYFDETKQEMVDGEVIESMVPLMLNRRIATELAEKEANLTDLRSVYGNWEREENEKR